MRDIRYKQILVRQLEMNRQTWEVLKQAGITDRSQIRLDFSFNAPSRDAADAMEAFIREETDYDVRVESTGSILGRQWRVEGTTQETAVSQKILDQWVAWMVMAGKELDCDFDGWGTSV